LARESTRIKANGFLADDMRKPQKTAKYAEGNNHGLARIARITDLPANDANWDEYGKGTREYNRGTREIRGNGKRDNHG